MFSKLFLIATAIQACLAAPHGARHNHGSANQLGHGHHHNNTESLTARNSMGNAVIKNRCSYDIWLWSLTTGSSVNSVHIPAGSTHSEAVRDQPTSMKISKSSKLSAGSQTQFEYSVQPDQIWYDISFVDCANGEDASNCPGHSEGLSMYPSDSSCTVVSCAPGSYCPTQAYYLDQPSVKTGIVDPNYPCKLGVDIVSTLC